MAAVQLDLAVSSGLHLESSYTWRLLGKFTCSSALGPHLDITWNNFEGLQKPSKASKSLQSPHLEGLRRPSKALKGLRRPPQACKGLTSKAFKGLERPSKASKGLRRSPKAFEGLTWKAFEGLRRLQDAPAVQQKGSKGVQKAQSSVFKSSEGPNRARTRE